MKILVLALSGIGDALMFTPALSLLRKKYPDAVIDSLVMINGVKEIYERNPSVNKVIYYNFMKEGIINSLKFISSLRGKYDVSINVYPSNRKEYNIINFLIGAKQKAGVEYLRMNASNLGWLNNVTVKENDTLHNVEENIHLVEKLVNEKFNEKPGLQIFFTKDDEEYAAEYLKHTGITKDEIVIGIHPGCATLKNHIKRRWEPEKFSELGRRILEEYNSRILIFGGPEETDLKHEVANGINPEKVHVIRTDNLIHSAAVMKRCNLFITNDSSLMHISSALGLKVIAIIGPTNTNYIHPWNTEHKIVSLNLDCAPCFYYSPKPLICTRTDIQFKCIKELTPEMVFKTARSFLNK
ncbi:MAG: glycosyltransferase family 9 protein [Ignavibacteriales bacterium]|nr:MAG: glycosyltransferase family 9 protein [Ignavibacteriales bacterium]